MSGENWELINGRPTQLGPRTSNQDFGSKVGGNGPHVRCEWIWDITDGAISNVFSAAEVGNEMYRALPANCRIISSYIQVMVPAAGGTDISVGLLQKVDAAEIDADGFITAAEGAAANLTTLGTTIVGGGALVGAQIGDEAGVPVPVLNGTFTAGKLKFAVEYIALEADVA